MTRRSDEVERVTMRTGNGARDVAFGPEVDALVDAAWRLCSGPSAARA